MPQFYRQHATVELAAGANEADFDLGVPLGKIWYLKTVFIDIDSGTQSGFIHATIIDLKRWAQAILINRPVWGDNQALPWHGSLPVFAGDQLHVHVANGILADHLQVSFTVVDTP